MSLECPRTCPCWLENECHYDGVQACKLCDSSNDEFTQKEVNKHCNQLAQCSVAAVRRCKNTNPNEIVISTLFPGWNIEDEPHQIYRVMLLDWATKFIEKNKELFEETEPQIVDEIFDDSPDITIRFKLKKTLTVRDIIRYVKD